MSLQRIWTMFQLDCWYQWQGQRQRQELSVAHFLSLNRSSYLEQLTTSYSERLQRESVGAGEVKKWLQGNRAGSACLVSWWHKLSCWYKRVFLWRRSLYEWLSPGNNESEGERHNTPAWRKLTWKQHRSWRAANPQIPASSKRISSSIYTLTKGNLSGS